jgi:hypothetical protein
MARIDEDMGTVAVQRAGEDVRVTVIALALPYVAM